MGEHRRSKMGSHPSSSPTPEFCAPLFWVMLTACSRPRNPVSLQLVPDMAKDVDWAFQTPIRKTAQATLAKLCHPMNDKPNLVNTQRRMRPMIVHSVPVTIRPVETFVALRTSRAPSPTRPSCVPTERFTVARLAARLLFLKLRGAV